MKLFILFFNTFLVRAFRKKTAYILHFLVPVAAFTGMYFLLQAGESKTFAGTQAIGLVVYFTMIQAALIVSLTVKDREQGVMQRINLSPAPPLMYVAGNGAAAFLVIAAQVLLFTLFVTSIFPVPLQLGFFELLAILLVFSITSIGFGFFICSLSDSASGAMIIANVVVMFTGFMGGSFFPVEFMKPYMRKIAYAFPQYWVMKALRQTQGNGSLAESVLSLVILLLFGGMFVVLRGAILGGRAAHIRHRFS